MWERKITHRILVGKPEGKSPLGRPWRKCENNIKGHLKVMGLEGMDWIDMAHDKDNQRAVVNAVMNLLVP
jgi:hypothetical protein